MMSNVRVNKKILIGTVATGVICVIFLYSFITNRSSKRYSSLFEVDVYGDGDYDAEAKDALLRKNREKIDYPVIEMEVKRENVKPYKVYKKIRIQNNADISLTASMTLSELEDNFFSYIETKDALCEDDRRVGYQHDGGYNVCFSPPFGLQKPCIVYSFGIGDDWAFDDATSKIYGCHVYSFDPSIKYGDNYNRSALITFRKLGIGPEDTINRQGWRVKKFETILKMNNHYKKTIDYLKFDIEYSEWSALHSMIQEGSLFNVKQVGFEMHTKEFFRSQKFYKKSVKQDYIQMFEMLKSLERQNFKQFNYRLNPFGAYTSNITKKARSCCYDIHFVNMNFAKPHHLILDSKNFNPH